MAIIAVNKSRGQQGLICLFQTAPFSFLSFCTDPDSVKQKMPFDPLIDAGNKHGEFSRGTSGLRVELQDHHSYRDSTPGPCL